MEARSDAEEPVPPEPEETSALEVVEEEPISGAPPIPDPELPAKAEPARSDRLYSLDAFRGLTIFGMLIVNNSSHGMAAPQWIEHAAWGRGVYMADFVFPWFLFIVGVAIPWSYRSFRKRGLSYGQYALKAAGRMLTLLFLGCFIVSSELKQPVFGLDVLQLIGLAYLIGALLYPVPWWARLGLAAGFLVGHWALVRFGHPAGMPAVPFSETDNVVEYLNRTYLQGIGLKGLISAIPTGAMVLLGSATGDLLREERWTPLQRGLALIGIGLVVAGLGRLWSLDLLFSKRLWSAPYILYTAGCGSMVLGTLYLCVDLLRWRPLVYPLVVFGSNAIVAYVLPILMKLHVLQEWTVPAEGGARVTVQKALMTDCISRYGPHTGAWLYTGGYIFVWWVVVWVLYRRKLFLRV